MEARLIRQCAPTLAGLKTGSLFLCPRGLENTLYATLRQWNRRLGPSGLYAIPLRVDERGALVYLYRPGFLSADLAAPSADRLLCRCGYSTGDPCRCVAQLIRRLRKQEEFPHEIGLFLGYPPEDVQGFIDHHGRHCKYAGLWKVYGDAEAARRRFAQYKKCTRLYCLRWQNGTALEQLAVPLPSCNHPNNSI